MNGEAAVPGILERIVERASAEGRRSRDAFARRLGREIAALDELISDQVNAIIHHPRFQALEASWRGLRSLVEQTDADENVRIRVISLSHEALARDLDRAVEFDQSNLFRKVYSEHFGIAGGEPFSVLIGDYQFRHQPSPEHPVNDVAVLRGISAVAAAAFAPFVGAAHPGLFGLDSFAGLQRQFALPETFQPVEYAPWRAFRETEEARFMALVLPRVLARLPWADDARRSDGFRFTEDVSAPDGSGYLWGNAVYAFASILMRAFGDTGWLADIRGVRLDEDAAG